MNKDVADAELFHLFWRNSELNPARAETMRERIAQDATREARPPRPLLSAVAVPLPSAPQAEADVWQQRRSQRDFAASGWGMPELGRLLHPLRARNGDGRERLLPSGGAKYPVLAYVLPGTADLPAPLAGNVAWYDPQAHGLVPLHPVPAWDSVSAALSVTWPEPPAAVVVLVAEAAGSLAKYGERGGRFVLIEAGIMAGALGQQAAAADWAGCLIGSFHDDTLLRMLGLSFPRHLAVVAYAVGGRVSA